jgi:hypothetical protein
MRSSFDERDSAFKEFGPALMVFGFDDRAPTELIFEHLQSEAQE